MNNNLLIEKYDIIKSLAGRDKDKYFLVLNNEKDFLYIVDGKIRKIEKPKKKKYKHCCLVKKNINVPLTSLNNKAIMDIIKNITI